MAGLLSSWAVGWAIFGSGGSGEVLAGIGGGAGGATGVAAGAGGFATAEVAALGSGGIALFAERWEGVSKVALLAAVSWG